MDQRLELENLLSQINNLDHNIMEFTIYNQDASSSDKVFIDGFPTFEGDQGVHALKDLIIAYQANLRQGNAKTKTRGEVSGTGKKPWRQKGTGMARQGSRRSPQWPGGGVAHGPKLETNYSQKINKKVKLLAFKRALFDAGTKSKIVLIKELSTSEPKTKIFNSVVSKISKRGTVLLVDSFFNDDLIRAARNISNVYMIDASSLNAWDVVRHDTILVAENAIAEIITKINEKG